VLTTRSFDTGNLGGIIAMQPWINTFGSGPAGAKVLTTGSKSLVTSILSAG
jgi:hypothetical protein